MEEHRRRAKELFRLALEELRTSRIVCHCAQSCAALPRLLELFASLDSKPLKESWDNLRDLLGDESFMKVRTCPSCHGAFSWNQSFKIAARVGQDMLSWMETHDPVSQGVCLACVKSGKQATCVCDGEIARPESPSIDPATVEASVD